MRDWTEWLTEDADPRTVEVITKVRNLARELSPFDRQTAAMFILSDVAAAAQAEDVSGVTIIETIASAAAQHYRKN